MAASKKITSSSRAKKNTSAKGSSANKRKSGAENKEELQKQQEQERRDGFRREIILWGLIAVSLLLFVSNLGIGGVVGGAISSVLFGVFGFTAYLIPVILLVGSIFYYVNRGNMLAMRILVATGLLVLFVCMLLSLLVHGAEALTPVQEYFYSVKNKFGGGFLGGVLSWLITNAFGLAGAYIIDIIGIIVCLVLITGKSAMRGMAKGGRKVVQTAQEAQQERRSRRSMRMDHKVSGVTRDTRIVGEETGTTQELPMESATGKSNTKAVAGRESTARGGAAKSVTGRESADREGADRRNASGTALDSVSDSANAQTGRNANRTLGYGSDGLQELYANPNVLSDELEEKLSHMESLEVNRKRTSASGRNNVSESPSDSGSRNDARKEPSSGRKKRRSAAGSKSDSLQELMPEEAYADDFSYMDATPEDGMAARKSTSARSLAGAAAVTRQDTDIQPAGNDDLPSHDQTGMQADASEYILPPTSLLAEPPEQGSRSNPNDLRETAQKLQTTLDTFGVKVAVTDISCGPTVTRYEIQPEAGVKVSKIVHLADDIKLNLAAADIRIEAPIPGKAAVGIEVPNRENVAVPFRELVESDEFQDSKSKISFAVGKDIAGRPVVADIAKMPHVLIAGATGSGKSVCINTIIMSVLYHAKPDEVKMILIDPKVVELNVYRGIPHLMIDVVTDPKKASAALNWAVEEMTDRYQKFADVGARKLEEYNEKVDSLTVPEGQDKPKKMCQILIVVDELADLMMVASREVEDAICRLAQLARAAGIHLVIATQRPSVNVITGLIKANMPSRIAFAVTSGVDSRTILDMNGAEKLLGKGDMLFYPQGLPKPIRVQGALVSDEEVSKVVAYIKEQNGPAQYSDKVVQKMSNYEAGAGQPVAISDVEPENGRDAYFLEAARVVVDKEKASIGMFQRAFKIGFNRAARIMDQLEEAGIVGPEVGTKPRKVLMNAEELQEFIDEE